MNTRGKYTRCKGQYCDLGSLIQVTVLEPKPYEKAITAIHVRKE